MLTIQNECLTLSVDPLGAQMMELTSRQGTRYLWDGNPDYWSGRAPVLFPFVARMTEGKCLLEGQIYQMGIHGFAKLSAFSVEEQTESSLSLLLEDSEQTRKQYPYRFQFRVRYALEGWQLKIRYQVNNRDQRQMHFSLGGHPGFRVPLAEGTDFEDYYLRFSRPCAPDQVGFTDALYLSGQDCPFPLEGGTTLRLRHDLFDHDAIVLKHMDRCVTLGSDKTGCAVTVDFPQMPYVGFWHMPRKDAPYVCVEPWLSLPARQGVIEDLACRSDFVHLEPGGVYCNDWCITVTEG